MPDAHRKTPTARSRSGGPDDHDDHDGIPPTAAFIIDLACRHGVQGPREPFAVWARTVLDQKIEEAVLDDVEMLLVALVQDGIVSETVARQLHARYDEERRGRADDLTRANQA